MDRTSKTRNLATGAALLYLAVFPATVVSQEQNPDPAVDEAFAERVEVRIVNVDVWVADRQGNAVTGLSVEDFEVLHDGEPVEVAYFDEIGPGASSPPSLQADSAGPGPVAVAPTAAQPGHVVIYFDESRLSPTSYPPLIRSLEAFLDGEGIEATRVLILRQDRGLSVEAPFGSSRADLRAALKRLSKGTAAGMSQRTEVDQALDAIRKSWEQSQDAVGSAAAGLALIPGGGGSAGTQSQSSGGSVRATVGGPGTGSGSGAGPDACGSFLGQIQPILDGWTRSRSQRVEVTLANLSDTASFLAGLPGVKTLLYLSDGLDTQPGAALASYASGLCPAGGLELMTGTLAEGLTDGFLELTRHANTNRVTVHALQTSGLLGSTSGDASSGRRARGSSRRSRSSYESAARSGEREGLRLIAEQTGGRAVFDQNDLGRDLARISGDLQTYYSLAYRPPVGSEGPAHRIEVRLADRSLTPRYRRGYRDKDANRWLTERVEGALNLGVTDNPLQVWLGAGVIEPAGNGLLRLPLHVMVPVESLTFLPLGDAVIAEVTMRVLARHIGTSALSVSDKTFKVRGAPGATGFADLAIGLELASGDYLTAIGVRDDSSRIASFVSTMLQVTE